MGSAWENWKKNNTRRQETGVVRPWDFVNPETEYVDEIKEKERLDTCKGCDKLRLLILAKNADALCLEK